MYGVMGRQLKVLLLLLFQPQHILFRQQAMDVLAQQQLPLPSINCQQQRLHRMEIQLSAREGR